MLAEVGFPTAGDRPTAPCPAGSSSGWPSPACSLLRPGLLLLDEPTANLDPVGAAEVRSTLAALADHRGPDRQPLSMIIVEHRVAEVLPLVNRVVVLSDDGGIASDGRPETILERHGSTLAARGVWVPGHPAARRQATSPPGDPMLLAEGVGYRYPDAST